MEKVCHHNLSTVNKVATKLNKILVTGSCVKVQNFPNPELKKFISLYQQN